MAEIHSTKHKTIFNRCQNMIILWTVVWQLQNLVKANMVESLTHRLDYQSPLIIKKWVKNHQPSPQGQIFMPTGRKTLSNNSIHLTLVSKLHINLQEVHLLILPLPITLKIWEDQPRNTSQQITKPDTLTSLSHPIKMKTHWIATLPS